jgi:hypothetical protein
MATTPIYERQYPLVALVDLGIANIGSGNGETIKLPPNAMIIDVFAHVVTAFNSATTTTVSASDGTTTFISAEDAKAAALTNVTVDVAKKFLPSGGTVTFSMAETGAAATAGRIIGGVRYVVLNRSNEIVSQ